MLHKKLNRIEFQALQGRNNDKIYISKSETDAILRGRCCNSRGILLFLRSTFSDNKKINRLSVLNPDFIRITIITCTVILLLTTYVSFLFRNKFEYPIHWK